MDEEWKLESTTDTACKLPHVERRQRTLNNDHSPPPWEELEDRMETPQEKEPVRWKSDNEESGRPFRDNIVVEGVNLEWNIGGEKEDRLPPRTGCKRQLRRRVPKGPKNRRSTKRTTLHRCEGAVDRRLRESFPFKN